MCEQQRKEKKKFWSGKYCTHFSFVGAGKFSVFIHFIVKSSSSSFFFLDYNILVQVKLKWSERRRRMKETKKKFYLSLESTKTFICWQTQLTNYRIITDEWVGAAVCLILRWELRQVNFIFLLISIFLSFFSGKTRISTSLLRAVL